MFTKKILSAFIALLMVFSILPLYAAAQPLMSVEYPPVAVADALAINGDDRTAGSALSSKTTSIGDKVWRSVSGLRFAQDEMNSSDSYITSDGVDHPYAYVPYNPSVETNIEADIVLQNSSWVAIGYSSENNYLWTTGQMWVYVAPTGTYQMYKNGMDLVVTGQAVVSSGTDYTNVKLQYNKATETASLWINGVEVETDLQIGEVGEINYAGFMITYPTASEQRIKNVVIRGEEQQSLAIADDLSAADSNRSLGSSLNGQFTPIAAEQWAASSQLVFAETAGKQYVTSNAGGYPTAFVPYQPAGDATSVEADIVLGSEDWSAIGYASAAGEFWTAGVGALWANINNNGTYRIYKNGVVMIAGGDAVVSAAGNPTHVKLAYNRVAGTITLWVNGIKYADHVEVGDLDGEILYAGFMICTASDGGQNFSNFAVRGEAKLSELPIEVFDDLAMNDTNRAEGKKLNYLDTLMDGRWWEASPEFVFAGDSTDSYITSKDGGSNHYPLAQVAYTPINPMTSISYDIQIGDMPAGWIALGYASDLNYLWFTGQLWVLLNASGYYQIYSEGSNKLLASGTADIDVNNYTNVKLLYNANSNTASLWIDDVLYVNSLKVGDAPLNIQTAGFMMTSPTAYGQKIKNFTIEGESEEVPPFYPEDIVKPDPSDFPIGVFEDANLIRGKKGEFKAIINDLQSRGLNAIMLSNASAERDSEMLEVSDKYGFDVFFGAHVDWYPWLHDKNAAGDLNAARDLVTPVVELLQDHPSVKGINISDEPELYTLEKHVNAAEIIHELAPHIKVSTPLIGFDRAGPMAAALNPDIYIVDVYPAAKINPEGDFSMNAYGYGGWDFISYTREVIKEKAEDTPLWMILQTHAYNSGRFSLREPLPAEVREQQWLAIGEGATGIFWFVYGSQLDSGWTGLSDNEVLFSEVEDLTGRLNPLRETLLSTKKDEDRFTATATGSAKPYISTLVEKNGDRQYVVAVNTDVLSNQLLTIESKQFEGQLKDLETDEIFTIGESEIDVRPGDGRMFEVIPSHSFTEPTVKITSVESGITLNVGDQLGFRAEAGAPEGIAKVTYYANGDEIGSSTAVPYIANWTVNRSGSYSITAVATTIKGLETTSEPIEIMVNGTDNMIQNASFEAWSNNSPTNWNIGSNITATLDQTVYRTGDSSLKLSGVIDEVVLWQDVTLQPNREYELSAWIKTDDVRGSGALLRTVVTGPAAYKNITQPIYGTKEWTRVHVKFTTPSVVTSSNVSLYLDARMVPGTVWVDDISFVATGAAQVSDGLTMHWSFDESAGVNVYDWSGNGHTGNIIRYVNGELTEFVPWAVAFDSGAKYGSSGLFFDGVVNYVQSQDEFSLDNETFTWSLWMNPQEFRDQIIMSSEQLSIAIEDGRLNVSVQAESGEWHRLTGPVVNALGWRHIAVVYDQANALELYINGERVASSSAVGNLAEASGAIIVGASLEDTSLNLHGYIDDLRIYDRALTGDELKRLALKLANPILPSEPGSENPPTEWPTNPNTAPTLEGTVTIPAGQAGQVHLKQLIQMYVPIGALDHAATITITEVTDADVLIADSSNPLASRIYEVLKTVSGNFNKPVTIRMAFDPDVVGNSRPAIFYYDEDAKTWVEVGGTVAEGNMVEATVDHFTKFAVFAVADATIPASFTDLHGHWAERLIAQASELGFVTGYPDGTFRPEGKVTRAEFVKLLIGALQPETTEHAAVTFADHNQIGEWARESIAAAVQLGWIQGYEDNAFRPNQTISRAEMAVIVARALALAPSTGGATSFVDDQDIPEWGREGIHALAREGLLTGRKGNLFAPSASATRAEAVVLILRALE
ncbi:S-layer homology domain-containing protein [Paenibacillus sp. strain BS8-2]